MEPAEGTLRLRLILGKYLVKQVDKGLSGFKAMLPLAPLPLIIDCPANADLRPGDLITLYTEVPYAQPDPTPIQ